MKFGLLGLPLETAHSTHLSSLLYSPLILFSTYHLPCLLVCLFLSGKSFISSYLFVLFCVCIIVDSSSNWSILCPKLVYPLGCCIILRNEHDKRECHTETLLHLLFSSNFYKRLCEIYCFDRNLHTHDV